MCNVGQKPKGFALVLVLWVLSLLTLMAGSFALSMRREVSATAYLKNTAQATALAESGIAVAEYMMMSAGQNNANAQQDRNWRTDGSVYQIIAGNARVRVRLLSETGKININLAEQGLLRALLQRAPVPANADKDPQRVTKLVDAILDWRDTNANVRPNGAEEHEYLAGLKYKPRNNSFRTIEELQRVSGMDAATFTWLVPLITVYSTVPQVDKTASEDVLKLLPDLSTDVLTQFLEDRLASARSGKPITVPMASKYINVAEPDASQSSAVNIIAEAHLEDGSSAMLSAVVIKSELDPVTPFQIVRWQHNYANEVSLFSTTMNELLVAQCIASPRDITC
jgi:general secretion pathway protein K